MAFTGISKETWAGTDSKTGFEICPVGHGLEFEIGAAKTGVEQANPENEYVTLDCIYTDDEGKKFHKWEYFQLTAERLGFLKNFLEKVGRCDMMEDDADWEDIIGTQFSGDVRHNKGKNGQTYANFDMSTIEAISHDIFEIEFGDDEEEELSDTDLDAKIEEQAAKNEQESSPAKAKKALKQAKSTDVHPKTGPKAASKASPRRMRRAAGADR